MCHLHVNYMSRQQDRANSWSAVGRSRTQRATHRRAEAQVHMMRDGHQFQAGAIMRRERKFQVRCWCGGSLPFEQIDNRLGVHVCMWVKWAEVGWEERSGISDSEKFPNLTQWGLFGRSAGAFGLAQLPEVPHPASSSGVTWAPSFLEWIWWYSNRHPPYLGKTRFNHPQQQHAIKKHVYMTHWKSSSTVGE